MKAASSWILGLLILSQYCHAQIADIPLPKSTKKTNLETYQLAGSDKFWLPNVDLIIETLENQLNNKPYNYQKVQHSLKIAYETKLKLLQYKLIELSTPEKSKIHAQNYTEWLNFRQHEVGNNFSSATEAGICGTVSFEISEKKTALELTKARIQYLLKELKLLALAHA